MRLRLTPGTPSNHPYCKMQSTHEASFLVLHSCPCCWRRTASLFRLEISRRRWRHHHLRSTRHQLAQAFPVRHGRLWPTALGGHPNARLPGLPRHHLRPNSPHGRIRLSRRKIRPDFRGPSHLPGHRRARRTSVPCPCAARCLLRPRSPTPRLPRRPLARRALPLHRQLRRRPAHRNLGHLFHRPRHSCACPGSRRLLRLNLYSRESSAPRFTCVARLLHRPHRRPRNALPPGNASSSRHRSADSRVSVFSSPRRSRFSANRSSSCF